MSKFILFPTPKGEYKIDLMVIAENRADWYKDEPRQDEIDFIMEDDFEGIDWLLNNMDFEDIEEKAIKVSDKVKVTDDDFWTSSEDFTIIEE
jgi:hypothetical protein